MKKSVKILWWAAFGFLGFIVLLVLLINFRIIGGMPSLEELENTRAALASEVIAEDGTILGKYYQVDRSSSDYNEISKNVINALIATEETLKNRSDMLKKFNKVQIETWEYIWNGHEDEAVQALLKQRPGMNLDPVSLKGQLDMNRPLFFTEATKGKRIGWQSEADWKATLKSMREAGMDTSKIKLEDLYTNALMPAEKAGG